MRECNYCGKPIARRKEKGGREREYCNDVCRQMAYRARHPEKRYIAQVISRRNRERWKEDPQLLPWQIELKAANERIERLNSEILMLNTQNSMSHLDLFHRDEEIVSLRRKLAEAQVEIVRLNVLLESQSKRR